MLREVSLALFFCLIALPGSLTADDSWDFKRVVEFAISNAPEPNIAAARVQIAQAQLGQANATLWPRLTLQSGYTVTDNPAAVFGSILNQRSYAASLDFNDVPTTDNFQARGVASYVLYSGGQNQARQNAAKSGIASAVADQETAKRDFAAQTANAYIEIAKSADFVKAIEASLRALQASEKAARGRVSSGAALKTELLDVQVQLAEIREDLIRAKNAHSLTIETLKGLLALEGSPFEISTAPLKLNDNIKLPAASERSEVSSVLARQSAATALVDEARAEYLPRLSAQAGYEYNRGWKFDGDGTSYNAGVVAEWEIWDGKLTARRVEESRANLLILKEQERRTREQIRFEKTQQELKLSEAKARVDVAGEAEKLASESAELTRLRFSQGLVSSTQLIDSERALTAASVRKAAAEAERNSAVVLLKRAYGLSPLDGMEAN